MYTDNYAVQSLELHLFFARIMKEHSIFLKAGFTPVNADSAAKAEFYKNEFEKLLSRAVSMSRGMICERVLCSGEIVTEYTDTAEKQTEKLTGICINHRITENTLRLVGMGCCCDSNVSQCQIKALNRTALGLLNGLIALKENVLNNVMSCKMFTGNYPLMIEHIIREAKLYREYVQILEADGKICGQSMKKTECFWNQIMMEHALFMRGLLDPTEEELIGTADMFAGKFAELLKKCQCAQERTMPAEVLSETKKLRDFKAAGAKGIEECRIRSLILPLLADHVLREANHYIRILEGCE